jgi:hypothetical protein
MEYRSQVDWKTLAGLLIGAVFTFSWLRGPLENWLLTIPALFVVFLFGFVYPVSYVTEGDAVILRAGMIRRRRIAYTDITRIAPSQETGPASYALAKEKLAVEYKGKKVVISPAETETFLVDVQMRCPQLSRRGKELRIAYTA